MYWDAFTKTQLKVELTPLKQHNNTLNVAFPHRHHYWHHLLQQTLIYFYLHFHL